jgi:adenylosuccinate synthase
MFTQEVGKYLAMKGCEKGVTTGRTRRCGWLDLVALRYACLINGVSTLCITKMDVLGGLPEIKLCVRYQYKKETLKDFTSKNSTVIDSQKRMLKY